MVAGAILGALGGAGLARGFELVQAGRRPAVTWGPEFLDRLAVETVVRYLAVAHFGRGRGAYHDAAAPPERQVERWRRHVTGEVTRRSEVWRRAWRELSKDGGEPHVSRRTAKRLRRPLAAAVRAALLADYPEAEDLLGRGLPDEDAGTTDATPSDPGPPPR